MIKRICLCTVFLFSVLSVGSAQTFHVDRGHTNVAFEVNRFGTVNVAGRFDDFSGQLYYDSTSNKVVSASFSIVVNSINTGHDIRDGHLQGQMWLDAKGFETIIFDCEKVIYSQEGMVGTGKLTIKGVTQDVEFPFEFVGPFVDPTKNKTIGVTLSATINRQDYGISFSKLMDNGKLFIGNEVEIRINALFQQ